MNKLYKYILGVAMTITALVACSPDQFEGADANKVPTTAGITITVSVNQETNTATASVPEIAGQWPVWYLDGNFYSTMPTISYTSLEAGTHTLEVKVGNRNGISASSVTETFTFNETKVDYSTYFTRLCDKEWRVAYEEAAHLGCGESGTDGSNWYTAGINEKEAYGIYDDRLVFTHSDSDDAAGGTYYYYNGDDGLTFVNTGVTAEPLGSQNPNDGNDFDAVTSDQVTTFTLIPGTYNDEDCLYLQFPTGTLIPYISDDTQLANPYFRIETLSNTKLTLIYDIEGSIAWRLVLTSREDTGLEDDTSEEAVFDWNPSSTGNLWSAVEDGSAFSGLTFWFADNNWSQIADPVNSHDAESRVWSLTIPDGTGSSQWQGQYAIHTTLSASMTKSYDLFLVVEADNDFSGMTIKLTEDGNDDNYFTADRHDVTADKQNVFKFEGVMLPIQDAAALSLIFDFGGAPEGTNVDISNIYFAEAVQMNYADSDNLWKDVDSGAAFVSVTPWFADDNWSQISDPEWSHSGGEWTVTNITCGSQQWQGQFPINTTLSADADAEYNFSVQIDADNDISGLTIKLTDTDDDNNYFTADRHSITADQTYTFKLMNATLPVGAAEKLSLFFDFGGAPSGTNVTISNVIFKKAE